MFDLKIYITLEVLLGASNPANFRVSVNDRGDAVVVNVHWSSSNALNTDNAFILSLVGQHWSVDAVTNGKHAEVHRFINE
jgi:hypothetical protein